MNQLAPPQNTQLDGHLDRLFSDISEYIRVAQTNIVHYVNNQIILSYWLIGKRIIEEEQQGAHRADYGSELLKKIAMKLVDEFGKGFSFSNLKNIRQFYLTYQSRIGYSASSLSMESQFHPKLTWTHYRNLMRIQDETERDFYEQQAGTENWSVRELQRQMDTKLYDRLTHVKTSEDKNAVIAIAQKNALPIPTPSHLIRDPYVLEFLNIPESHKMIENKLEEALVTHLQQFLLEIGKGFAFVGRQYRLTIDGDHYYCDLVFYHVVLKCYLIVDLKTKALTHADWGQMQLYVRYFDKEIITAGDNPTIGLILCTDKKEALIKYLMDNENNQIFASKYQFHLPTEEQLEALLKEEQALIEGSKK